MCQGSNGSDLPRIRRHLLTNPLHKREKERDKKKCSFYRTKMSVPVCCDLKEKQWQEVKYKKEIYIF